MEGTVPPLAWMEQAPECLTPTKSAYKLGPTCWEIVLSVDEIWGKGEKKGKLLDS